MTHDPCSVTIVRRLEAPVDEVYAAWTDPVVMRTWLSPVVDADARVGGRYRIENHDGGAVHVHSGEYLAIDPGRRIEQTFRYEGPTAVPFLDERVTIVFRAIGPHATELTLTHSWSSPAARDEDRRALTDGWGEWLDLLGRSLSASSAPAPRS